MKRKVVSLTSMGPFTFYGSFSFVQTELLSSLLVVVEFLWENTRGILSIKYYIHTYNFVLIA